MHSDKKCMAEIVAEHEEQDVIEASVSADDGDDTGGGKTEKALASAGSDVLQPQHPWPQQEAMVSMS